MDLKDEYQRYLRFIKNMYPRSSLLKEGQLNKFSNIIHINLKAIKLLNTYFEIDCIDQDTKLLINDLRFYFMRLLYILPTNDFYFIDVILRTMSENILRIIYVTTHEGTSYDNIITFSHRQLWNNGIKCTETYHTYKEAISSLNRIYGTKSSTVHSSQNKYDNTINYLVNLMEKDTIISVRQLSSDVEAMFNFLYKELFNIFELQTTNLTLHQSVSLQSLA